MTKDVSWQPHIFTCEKPTLVGVSVADAVGCNKRDYSSVWKLNYPLSNLLIDVIFLRPWNNLLNWKLDYPVSNLLIDPILI